MEQFVYKICSESEWSSAKKKDKFKGTKKDIEDGYIHLSKKDQIRSTLAKYFFKQNKLVLIKIDNSKLQNLIWEKSTEGQLFPHLYSYLSLNQVVQEYKILFKKNEHVLPSNF
jgi:uncharacterized protein (DUF952 family)